MSKRDYIATLLHDKDDIIDYTLNYEDFLCVDGDFLVSSTWVAESGITIITQAHDNIKAVVWVTGGTVGKKYKITNTIHTNKGRVLDRTIRLKVEEL